MKWKAEFRREPVEGTIRVRRKFAWLPVHYYIDTEMYYCWLESYQVTEKYTKTLVKRGSYYAYELQWKVVERRPLYWEGESVK